MESQAVKMRLWVEYEERPIAIATRKPRFSWVVPLTGRDRRQSSYRILVATSEALLEPGKADLWDSGMVASAQSVHVVYAGAKLASNMDCWWRVQVWDEQGQGHGFSDPAYFGTALLDESDWQARWIGMGPAEEPVFDPYSMSQSDATSGGLRLADVDFQKMAPALRDYRPESRAPLLRKVLSIGKPVRRARAFVCGIGLFELHLNGGKVGNDVLPTPRTEFRKRVFYLTYDVTDQLSAGENVIGIILGNGWYNAQKKYWHWQAPWYGEPRALVQVELEYADGSTGRVLSDGTWQGDWSPIGLNCIYDGEDYDARLEQPGWDSPGFDARGWRHVNLVPPPGGRLVAIDHAPNRVMQRFSPVALSEPRPGCFVFDMGTVMTGWTALRIPHGRAGGVVMLRYSELLFDSGMIRPRMTSGCRQSEQYTMKGAACESYEPRFTYHGFRYVELTGFPGTPGLDTLEACLVHSGVEPAGTFECGNELINKIHRCTLQSQRCNLQMGVPTDDTQREERLGWCGDAWSLALESFYNLDTPRFWAKWIADFHDQQDEQSGLVGYICPLPGWGEDLVWSAAFILIPWWHYLHYGDHRILEASYPHMKKYLAYLEQTGRRMLPDLVGRKPGDLLFPQCALAARYPANGDRGYLQHSWFADHLATHEGGAGMGRDQPRSMATAFYHYDAVILARIADTLGHADDARHFRVLADKIKAAFNERFLDDAGGYYDVGCQSIQALAIAFGLVPEASRNQLIGYLASSVNFRQRRMTSGYAGTKWVVQALADSGRPDIVWNRAIATDYPSWGYMLRGDKTTIAENWAGGASQCHTTLGAAIDEWFFWGLAGIRADEAGPGFERIIIRPYLPAELPWVRASLETVRGTIAVHWSQDDVSATLRISIPANSTATVHIPESDPNAIREAGQALHGIAGIEPIRSDREECVLQVGSGDYCFTWENRKACSTAE